MSLFKHSVVIENGSGRFRKTVGSLQNVSTQLTLEQLGWDRHWEGAFAAAREALGDVEPARVSADFGVELRVISTFGEERATLTGKLRFEEGVRPAVGDFVCVAGEAGQYVIVDVLPRRTWLGRQAPGKQTGMQLIGANLDRVFVVTSFNEDFNFNRLERYIAAIHEGGAQPAVIVNKADLLDEEERDLLVGGLRERLGDVLPILETSTVTQSGLDDLWELLEPETTSSFVGSSGVGKSTIVNALLGEQRQAIKEVRAYDSRGRHTTTHRELFVLPNGALVVDTPGMREFQLWDTGAGTDAFDDIEELAAECKFRDCGHESEPGCAVRGAVEAGELDAARLESWRKLQREADHQRTRQNEAQRREGSKELTRMSKEGKHTKKRRDE